MSTTTIPPILAGIKSQQGMSIDTKRLAVALLVFFLPAAIVVSAEPTDQMEPPNVVILLADDLGWNAVGYHNAEFETPNIDRLMAEGMELDRFYVAPMCTPTRAGLMTGRYPIRFGCARAVIPPQRDFGLPVDETTLAELLGRLGYQRRGVFGKWHLGHRRAKWHPLGQGFTHFHGHYNGAIDYFELTREGVRDWHTNYATSDEQGYSTDLIAEAAATWIDEAATHDAPYFCYVPFNAPHSPFQAPEDAIARFEPSSKQDAETRSDSRNRGERNRQIYAAMIWQMDRGIGTILDAIKDSGEADRTLVWFFSDNGGVGSLRELNVPLRGSKLTVFEGGIRVPACVRWPNRIGAGSRSDAIIGYIDLLPTLVAAAGGDAQKLCDRPLDGINVLPLLTGKDADSVSSAIGVRSWYSYHGQAGEQSEHLAVTSGGWKLKVNGPRLKSIEQLEGDANEVQLFHLEVDPYEKTNLRDEHPERVETLGRLLVTHRKRQPPESVPPYRVGKQGFVPPEHWKLDPDQPEALVGSHTKESGQR